MSKAGGFGSLRHLALRFFGALDPRGPDPVDEDWAVSALLPGEISLWGCMSGPDRRHAVGVARDVVALLASEPGPPPGRDVVAAALLHDVGKIESGFGTFSRVAVTLAAIALGRQRLARPGTGRLRTRVSQYLTHDRIGADMLRQAGSDPLTVAWTEEHHLDPARWNVEPRLANALKAADGD